MGLNLQTACHKCKIRIFHYRSEENLTIIKFYYKHRKCLSEDKNNLETLEDQIQEADWMADYPADKELEAFARSHITRIEKREDL